jgi:hypothetical protein
MLKSKLSLSRHFEYANKQITYHFWLCVNQAVQYSITHRYKLQPQKSVVIEVNKKGRTLKSIEKK